MTNKELYDKIKQIDGPTAWDRGVKEQALEMVEQAEVKLTKENVKRELLNGAGSWHEYSYGGNALFYDWDIAARYRPQSDLTENPNAYENWLDFQARALQRAYLLIKRNI